MVTQEEKDKYSDWISYIDDDGKQVNTYVKIIEVSTFVKFETLAGTTLFIPSHRVLKIKQRGESI
jgi:uncharacterized protein (UPF0248 family)